MPGFETSVIKCQDSLMINIEQCFKQIRKTTVLEVIKESYKTKRNTEILNNLGGQIVMTIYNSKFYRISKIDEMSTPSMKFFIK